MTTQKPTRTQRRRARQTERAVAADMLKEYQRTHPVSSGVIPLVEYVAPRWNYTI